jgi:hypothetical protein
MVELYEERVINGLLKAGITTSPEAAADLISCDWEIVLPSERSGEGDLWPAAWALSSALLRQFKGKVFIRTYLESLPPMPVALGGRCIITSHRYASAKLIGLGCAPQKAEWFGDARGNEISVHELIASIDYCIKNAMI